MLKNLLALLTVALPVGLLPVLVGAMRSDFGRWWLILVVVLAVPACFSRLPAGLRFAGLSACLVFAFVATACDLALRLVGDQPPVFRPHERLAVRWPTVPELIRYRPNQSLTMDSYGDLAAISGRSDLRAPRRVRFTTDARGFRNDPHEGPIAAVLLGDSFGAANGTSQEDGISEQLTRQSGRNVYNVSVGAQGPSTEWLTWLDAREELELEANAWLVWLLFTGNDLDDRCRARFEKPRAAGLYRRARAWFTSFRKRSPLRHRLDSLVDADRSQALPEKSAAGPEARDLENAGLEIAPGVVLGPDSGLLYLNAQEEAANRDLDQVRAHENFPCVSAVLREAAGRTSEHGVRILLVVAPTKGDVHPMEKSADTSATSGFAAAIQSLAADVDLAFLDLTPALRSAAAAGETLYWSDDTHWGPAGHAAAARAIAGVLAREDESGP